VRPTLTVPFVHLVVSSQQAFVLAAVLVCIWLGPRWAEKLAGFERRTTRCALLCLGLAAFVGGRAHFVAGQWGMFADRPWRALYIWSGGLHAAGAVVLLAVAVPLVCRWMGLPVARFADAFVPTVGVGIAIARLGCFSYGCCFGTVCRWPWCLSFPRDTYIYEYHTSLGLLPADGASTAPIHPLQLYFAGAGLLLTLIGFRLHRRRRYDGQVTLVILLVYALSAAGLELFRADSAPRVYWGPLPQLEWVALGIAAVSGAALVVAEINHRPRRGAGTRRCGEV